MSEAVFAIPGPLDTPSGSYIYDRRVIELMPSFGVTALHLELEGNFPSPTELDLRAVEEKLLRAPSDAKIIIDGLALGVLPGTILEKFGDRIIGLVHQPLANRGGLTQKRRDALVKSERAALSFAGHVIATSDAVRELLVTTYGVVPDLITVAEPGTDPASRATGTGTPLQILAVGAVGASSGYDVFIDALTPLEPLEWRLTIIGALDAEPDVVDSLTSQIAAAGLIDRVTLAGSVVPATLARHYESADIFVLPSRSEGYAMALCEAMVRGLTIVTTHGRGRSQAIPDHAALKIPADDKQALQDALLRVLDNKKLRVRLADAAWEAGRDLPTWNETARRIAAVIMGLRV